MIPLSTVGIVTRNSEWEIALSGKLILKGIWKNIGRRKEKEKRDSSHR
jgi:hypothetical protein